MHPATRTPVDGRQEEFSLLSGLDCSDDTDTARQEFKNDADINKLLAKYGINVPQRPVRWDVVDYDLDLSTGMIAIDEAKKALANLPTDLRNKYPTWQALMEGIDTGELRLDLAKAFPTLQEPVTPPSDTQPPKEPGAQ